MPEDYEVKSGDCMSSIAYEHGFLWETLWNLSENAQLKQKRKNPNVLMPGDLVTIPEKRKKEEPAATEKKHQFKLKGVPAQLRLRVLKQKSLKETAQSSTAATPPPRDPKHIVNADPPPAPPPEDEPRAKVPYSLEIDGRLIRGNTDGDGRITCNLPPNARFGLLVVEPGTLNQLVVPLRFGGLNPVSEVSGVKQRLANLGFECGDRDETAGEQLKAAIEAFQRQYDLKPTGELDQQLKDKLEQIHGS